MHRKVNTIERFVIAQQVVYAKNQCSIAPALSSPLSALDFADE